MLVWKSVFLLTTLGALSPSHIYPPPSSRLPCTCLVQAAVGGRALAVSGTFHRRSHPVNPLGLGQTAPHLIPSHLHYLQYPPLPPSLRLPPLSFAHGPPSTPPQAPTSPGQTQMEYCFIKGGHCENEIKGRVPPTCTPTLFSSRRF